MAKAVEGTSVGASSGESQGLADGGTSTANIGASIIRTGFWGMICRSVILSKSHKEQYWKFVRPLYYKFGVRTRGFRTVKLSQPRSWPRRSGETFTVTGRLRV